MSEYRVIDTNFGQSIQRISDGAFIPKDEKNSDYHAFLLWQAAGGEALLAETAEAKPE